MLRNFWQVSYWHQDGSSQNVMYVYISWRACYDEVSYLIGLRWAQDSIFLLNSQISSGCFFNHAFQTSLSLTSPTWCSSASRKDPSLFQHLFLNTSYWWYYSFRLFFYVQSISATLGRFSLMAQSPLNRWSATFSATLKAAWQPELPRPCPWRV